MKFFALQVKHIWLASMKQAAVGIPLARPEKVGNFPCHRDVDDHLE